MDNETIQENENNLAPTATKWQPIIEEILYCDPAKLFHYFAKNPWAFFFDSARIMPKMGQHSFICLDPFLTLTSRRGQIHLTGEQNKTFQGDPFIELKKQLSHYLFSIEPQFGPFQGGVAGYLSYDLGHHIETLPNFKIDDMQFLDMAVGFYDLILSFDHTFHRAYIISSGFPEKTTFERNKRAKQRIKWLLDEIANVPECPPISRVTLSPQDISSNFTKDNYIEAVKKTREYILAGDIFEGTVSQRFKATLPSALPPYDLYRRLRIFNEAPFSAYLNIDNNTVIASASPERFLQLKNKQVETRPIKGTRKRGKTPKEDMMLAKELLSSEKDWAENVMIVDLMRNDLSRVCLDHSVKVPELCKLETYATVHHLVSSVVGTLKAGCDAIDLLRATFPGGSITGAPKIRAMEIIAELEPTSRGPYTGSIGYIGFDGNMDSSITIRTYAIKNDTVTYQAGGAIVADSNPEEEYQESIDKAKAMLRSLVEAVETGS